MSLVVGNQYRGRGVEGQFVIRKISETMVKAEGLIEITHGDDKGRRIRWDGWITNKNGGSTNAERTADELRAMGCKVARWGDFSGVGAREVEFKLMADVTESATYYRAAFVRPLTTIDKSRQVATADDLAALAPPPPPEEADADDVSFP